MEKHTWLFVVLGVAAIIWFQYRSSGAASNCSIIDTFLGKCGTSA